MPEGYRKCCKCKEVKPYGEFFKNKSRGDGYSNRCKTCSKTHQRKPNSTCEVCGKQYYARSVKDSRFCSKACSGKSRDARVETTCSVCGKSYTIHRYELESGIGRYCSISCSLHERSGEKCPSWKGGAIEITCLNCNKQFKAKPYRKNEARFCSRGCAYQWNSGENSHNWRGGLSKKEYPVAWTESFRRTIRQRDGYTCALCGNHGNAVHHIDYVKENTYPSNCITLCRRCHGETNVSREYWLPIFANIMLLKSNGAK